MSFSELLNQLTQGRVPSIAFCSQPGTPIQRPTTPKAAHKGMELLLESSFEVEASPAKPPLPQGPKAAAAQPAKPVVLQAPKPAVTEAPKAAVVQGPKPEAAQSVLPSHCPPLRPLFRSSFSSPFPVPFSVPSPSPFARPPPPPSPSPSPIPLLPLFVSPSPPPLSAGVQGGKPAVTQSEKPAAVRIAKPAAPQNAKPAAGVHFASHAPPLDLFALQSAPAPRKDSLRLPEFPQNTRANSQPHRAFYADPQDSPSAGRWRSTPGPMQPGPSSPPLAVEISGPSTPRRRNSGSSAGLADNEAGDVPGPSGVQYTRRSPIDTRCNGDTGAVGRA